MGDAKGYRVYRSAPDGGTGPGKKYWRFDDATQSIWRTHANLRYRLMPYVYAALLNAPR